LLTQRLEPQHEQRNHQQRGHVARHRQAAEQLPRVPCAHALHAEQLLARAHGAEGADADVRRRGMPLARFEVILGPHRLAPHGLHCALNFDVNFLTQSRPNAGKGLMSSTEIISRV
jgi:hypothetical protein